MDRALVLRAMALLPLTEAGFRLIGFRQWKRVIEHFSSAIPGRRTLKVATEDEMAERIARAARSAERHGAVTPNCLERSLTLWWMLRREGIEGDLHIGARKDKSGFEAHAWVEVKGVVLNDSTDIHKHYARFDAPIAADLERSHAAGKTASR